MERTVKKIILATVSFFVFFLFHSIISESSAVDMSAGYIESFTMTTWFDEIRIGLLGSVSVLLFFCKSENAQKKRYISIVRKISAIVLIIFLGFVKMESEGDWLNILICVILAILLMFLIFYKTKNSTENKDKTKE